MSPCIDIGIVIGGAPSTLSRRLPAPVAAETRLGRLRVDLGPGQAGSPVPLLSITFDMPTTTTRASNATCYMGQMGREISRAEESTSELSSCCCFLGKEVEKR